MFVFGGLMIGIAIETSGLHQKLAFKVVMIVGSEPKWYAINIQSFINNNNLINRKSPTSFKYHRLLLGVMSVTGFLALWISNTAVTAMMLPIVVSLVKNIVKLDPAFQEEKPMAKFNHYTSSFILEVKTI